MESPSYTFNPIDDWLLWFKLKERRYIIFWLDCISPFYIYLFIYILLQLLINNLDPLTRKLKKRSIPKKSYFSNPSFPVPPWTVWVSDCEGLKSFYLLSDRCGRLSIFCFDETKKTEISI